MIVADTSVLLPAVVADHEAHRACRESAMLTDGAIAHCLLELFAVLTRLPEPNQIPARLAAEAVRTHAPVVIGLPSDLVLATIDRLATDGITGGAAYDGLIASTVIHHEATLLTRDHRASRTYERLGVDVRWVAT